MSGTDTPEASGTEPMGVSEGADAIANLLFPSDEDKNASEATSEAEPEHEVTDEAVAEGEDEAEVSDDDTEQSESETPEPEEVEEPRYRLPDGTEVTLAEIEEWRKGNLRQSDYTRKTMELAATRKELETRHAEISQKSEFFQKTIDFAIDIAAAHLPAAPDPRMAQSDPIAYMQQKADYDARLSQLQQLHAAKQQHQAEITQQSQQAHREMAQSEAQSLMSAMPELRDPEKLKAFHAELIKGVQGYGIKPEEVAQVMDHRLFLLAKDAMAYRKLMSQKPKAVEKAKDAPPVQKPGNRASPQQQQARAKQEKLQKLRQTGSLKDGANVILEMLEE